MLRAWVRRRAGAGPHIPGLAVALLLGACATPVQPVLPTLVAPATGPVCSDGRIAVSRNVAQAGIAACTISAEGVIETWIAPETSPINPSPWYAFGLTAPDGSEPVLTLRYAEAQHRYHPWLWTERDGWRRLEGARVTRAQDGSATVRLPPLHGPAIVSAQPLDDPARALLPFERLAQSGMLERIVVAQSVDGEPIPAYLHRPADAKGLLLLLTRQHPPERPGAVAFDHFAALLLGDHPEMEALRREVAILFLPVMNPDGIRRGHWRGNANGRDLNRDWGFFREPETAGAGALVERLASELPLLFAMDFHATRRDILYAPPESPDRHDIGHVVARALGAHPATAHLPVSRSHTPNAGTLKGWTLDRFGRSGLTWEAGDNTPDHLVRAHAGAAAWLVARATLDHVAGPRAEALLANGSAGE